MNKTQSNKPNVLIEASAGSGKTYQLVKRMIEILDKNAEPSNIIAITFSRKAAREIADRLFKRLIEDDNDKNFEILKKLIINLHKLHISTIDSLAFEVLRMLHSELGLSEDLSIVEETSYYYQKLLNDILKEILVNNKNTIPSEIKQDIIDHPIEGVKRIYSKIYDWIDNSYHDIRELDLNNFNKSGNQELTNCAFEKKAGSNDVNFQEEISENTETLINTISNFNDAYLRRAREYNVITFNDIIYLLHLLFNSDDLKNDDNKSQQLNSIIQSIMFRLDCQLNHWLIDEFQDTSLAQWKVIENFVDEALQNNDGTKSFFCVGDKKQSIYGWRGGKPELMDYIKQRYPKNLETYSLSQSYRSTEQIINFVNKLFGAQNGNQEDIYPDWMWSFTKHSCAAESPVAQERGYVEVKLIVENHTEEESEVNTSEEDDDVIAKECAYIIDKIKSKKDDLSIAILVRSNKEVDELSRALRKKLQSKKFHIYGKGNTLLSDDNLLVPLFISMFTLVQHPGDEAAKNHIHMSPLASWFEQKYNNGAYNFSSDVLAKIAREGLWSVINEWVEELTKSFKDSGSLNEYTKYRIENIREILFDTEKNGITNLDDLIGIFKKAETPATDVQKNAVLVSTIHQAKGLEFDAVVLPFHKTRRRAVIQCGDLYLHTENKNNECVDRMEPQWALIWPKKEITEKYDFLKNILKQEEKDNFKEELNLLYVAVTRAKYALYILIEGDANSNKSKTGKKAKNGSNIPSITEFILNNISLQHNNENKESSGGYSTSKQTQPKHTIQNNNATKVWSEGYENWFEQENFKKMVQKEQNKQELSNLPNIVFKASRLKKEEPSSKENSNDSIARLFEKRYSDALDFGTAIHNLLSRIEWLEQDKSLEEILEDWKKSFETSANAFGEIETQFENIINSEETRKIFSKPNTDCIVWREKAFCFVKDQEQVLVSGIFDRVHIERDGSGQICRVIIYDFKSDKITEEEMAKRVDSYRKQLLNYREAVAKILGIKNDVISTFLVFTHLGKLLEIK